MFNALARLLLGAIGIWLASRLFDGVQVDSFATLLWAALLLAIANTIVRPALIFLTLPATILSLGLFLLVINAAMLGLVAWLLDGFRLAGFWAALGTWALVTATQMGGSVLMSDRKITLRIEKDER